QRGEIRLPRARRVVPLLPPAPAGRDLLGIHQSDLPRDWSQNTRTSNYFPLPDAQHSPTSAQRAGSTGPERAGVVRGAVGEWWASAGQAKSPALWRRGSRTDQSIFSWSSVRPDRA